MSGIASEILLIFLLLVINGVFAMSEIAVVTSRKLRLERRAESGDAGARVALELAQEPTQFLSTVQVGITLIGVLAGAFGGATLAAPVAVWLRRVPAVAAYADGLALTLVVGAITYLSLIVGELVPKRIALASPERIASALARPMRALSRVTAPVVKLLTGSTNLMIRLLGVRPHGEPGITEEEIRALVEQGARTGVVQRHEQEIVESVFRLGDRQVSSLMTPRLDVHWLDVEDDAETIRAQLADERSSLLLVCRGDVDGLIGFVQVERLLARCVNGAPLDGEALIELARPPHFVPATMPAYRLLDVFRAARQHAAVVLDEYGGVAGVVTLDDVLEALVGEVPEEGDQEEAAIVRRPDGSWLIDGMTPIPDVEVELGTELVTEERPGYFTLGGFVLARLSHLPRAGERVESGGFAFEVVDMDGRRIDKLLVTPLRRRDAERGG
ncbi:MAG TPA: hemolysin family protein [Gemmatimonadaceae bacterium]|nr:hemolysin family protein [Gemmatimonadaceae bacterium]